MSSPLAMSRERKPKYVVGIDLGTTNSAIAYANIASAKRFGGRAVKTLAIPQLVARSEIGKADMLPSFLYIGSGAEFGQGTERPWHETDSHNDIVGRFAREQGAKVTGRLVSSAKSWLSYDGVDRTAKILPWGSKSERMYSPVGASAAYLHHLAAAWNDAFPKAPLQEQDVVLTVPASFDDVARTLTVDAAKSVGLTDNLVLLEEPQAAFYEYFRANSDELSRTASDRRVLVADVGGGTTDFTLIEIQWADAPDGPLPSVRRLAVGDHILLGGDNMDLALAHVAEKSIAGTQSLDAGRMNSLVQACRTAKEVLLAEPGDAPETFKVTVPGRGKQLVGGAQSFEFSRDMVERLVLDGFVPSTAYTERPKNDGRRGLSAWGLPYAKDPAITRHVSAFLSRQNQGDLTRIPNTLLLNGGVFKSPAIRRRFIDTISGWRESEQEPVDIWEPQSFDLAVARGAATYGLVRHGIGHRVGGGAARAYYVGVHSGKKKRAKSAAVCLLPRHIEPGKSVLMADRVFNLVLGRPVRFSLFSTTSERLDEVGDLVELDSDQFTKLPPIQTVLEAEADVTEVPVTLRAELSEIGILEVAAQCVDRDTQYRLDFSLRGPDQESVSAAQEQADEETQASLSSDKRDRIEDIVRRTYGKPRKDVDPREIKWIRKSLEEALDGTRDTWPATTCRAVWDCLKVGARRRRRSERHEATFFHLTGFCLRPGFGDGFDEWRMGEVWKFFEPGIHFFKDAETWNAWWIMWRRISGGLDAAAQLALLDRIEPWLRPSLEMRNRKKPKYLGAEEAIRLVGALERIPIDRKIDWGRWFLEQASDVSQAGRPAWCLARLGARQPFYGSPHLVIPPDVAQEWLESLLAMDWRKVSQAAFAAASIARMTGDRARDVDDDLRRRVASRLERIESTHHMAEWVKDVVKLSVKDEVRFLGDSLPEGLKLVST
ncbi:MAG: Hsp70 family protein [Myxococcota bacterium]|nr:Hsp70 family protein [Myxococcota bacterium]